ncbi:MAG: T9SS type A sorting domain-containing protein [Bacteroidia bacterium]|nr:T9SS type A sorting domain-containing protein [Bacteroidia bacterium]
MNRLNKKIVIVAFGITILGITTIINTDLVNKTRKYIPRAMQQTEVKGIKGAMEYLNSMMANPKTGVVDPKDVWMAKQQADELLKKQRSGKTSTLGIKWIELGPDNIGGRTRGMLIDKDDNDLMFACSVGGGLFISQSGGSAWKPVNDTMANLATTCIIQASNGDIYVGTGEGALAGSAGTGSSGVIGAGIWKSTDRGTTWEHLESTAPFSITYNSSGNDWSGVYRLAADPSDAQTIYAAAHGGLFVTTDGGDSWTDAPGTSGGTSTDVKIGSDGTIVAIINDNLYRKEASDTDFENRAGEGGFPKGSAVVRVELAISQSDPDYMYAACAASSGMLYNIYQSKDNGENWTVIGPGGGSQIFYPFSYQGGIAQGWYDNVIAVHPTEREIVFVGGISYWRWKVGEGWKRLNSLFQSTTTTTAYYVHADNHAIMFHPAKPNMMYIGNDGGIYRTTNCLQDQPIFTPMNKGYNVTQFYSVAASADGKMVLGGTQDNGTNLIDSTGNTGMAATEVQGGDGGFCEISAINPQAMFAGQPNEISRSPNGGASFSNFLDGNTGDLSGQFVTAFKLWENFNDVMSSDSILFVADTSYSKGDTLLINGMNQYKFAHVLKANLAQDDTLMIQDLPQAKYFVSLSGSVWMTKEALVFSKIPEWYKIGSSITARSFAVTEDGNTVFVGTSGGILYRLTGLQTATYSYDNSGISSVVGVTKKQLYSFSGSVCGLALDEDDPDNLIVCIGNYGSTNHVYLSKNATGSSPTFTSKQGNLPSMPVYDGVFFTNANDGKKWIVLGTELGIYATDDDPTSGTPTWYEENDGMSRVATFSLKKYKYSPLPNQSWGGHRLYAGTHGRGMYKSAFFVTGINDKKYDKKYGKVNIEKITIYPNPVMNHQTTLSYELKENREIIIDIYNLAGQKISSVELGRQITGIHEFKLQTYDLNRGSYFVRINTGKNEISTGKFIIVN